MGAPSTYMQLRAAWKEIERLKAVIEELQTDLYCSKGFTIQQCMDMAMISNYLEFGHGPVYNARFEKRFRRVFTEFSTICVEDGEADEELVYTKAKVDEFLRAACGSDILEFDQRYAVERMYFRDRRDDWQQENNQDVQIGHEGGVSHDG